MTVKGKRVPFLISHSLSHMHFTPEKKFCITDRVQFGHVVTHRAIGFLFLLRFSVRVFIKSACFRYRTFIKHCIKSMITDAK